MTKKAIMNQSLKKCLNMISTTKELYENGALNEGNYLDTIS